MDTERIELRGGKREGAGRPKKLKTQVKDFIKEHPYAVETLMKTLYDMGVDGDRDAAQYIIDRIKGKPKISLGFAEEDKELAEATVLLYYRLLDERKLLGEGHDIKQEEDERAQEG